jgi:hypothetical protein
LQKSELLRGTVSRNDISISTVEMDTVVLVDLTENISETIFNGFIEEEVKSCIIHTDSILERLFIEISIPGSVDPEL